MRVHVPVAVLINLSAGVEFLYGVLVDRLCLFLILIVAAAPVSSSGAGLGPPYVQRRIKYMIDHERRKFFLGLIPY